MKKTFLFLALLIPVMSWGQTKENKENKPKVSIHGFIRTDLIGDSRQNVYALEGMYAAFPKKPELDANGEDINDQGALRELSLFSRLSFKVIGPDIFNAKTSGLIEFDAMGGVGKGGATNELRFRHAFVKLDWTKSSLVVGRTWHPFFVTSTFPIVLNLNTGIPYQPFSRSPQISFTKSLNEKVKAQISAIYQSQYANVGPDGKSPDYQRNAVVPNLNFLLKRETKDFKAGISYDLLVIQPDLYTVGINNKKYKSTKLLYSNRFMAYADAILGKLEVKAKTTYGQNMSDLLLGGGYAISDIKESTGEVTYTQNYNSATFVELLYKCDEQLTLALFGGYMTNKQYQDELYTEKGKAAVYAKYADVDYSYRISPAVYYKVKNMKLGAEYEYNVAAYGDFDFNNKGEIDNSEEVSNHRLTLSLCYFF